MKSEPSIKMERPGDKLLLHALTFERVLRAYLGRFTRNRSDVDELLQETYARLLVAGSKPQPVLQSLRAFCLTVAKNAALDWLRHRQIVPIELVAEMEALEVHDELQNVEEIVCAQQELALLANAVEQLSPRCGHVFTLRKAYGFSQKEIAEHLQISENTVHRHLADAVSGVSEALLVSPLPEPSTLFERLTKRRRKK
jgi:RNA polymerase sigma factor (sigma-70 family)